jgi:hypothetical protein
VSESQALIKVAVCNVAQLLSSKRIKTEDQRYIQGQLSIPEYQRPYVWGEKQIDKLIEDLKDHQEQFTNSPYYLGSVILHAQDECLNIIDGQQRLTTLALLGYLNSELDDVSLTYQASLSIQHIKQNLQYLEKVRSKWEDYINFENIVVSLVVTESEDDAYKFFETQNTGGVRLTGPDIIKAHHLRAIPEPYRNHYAKEWEDLGELQGIVMTLLRGRYWNSLKGRAVPFYQEKQKIRDEVVDEFANRTLKHQDDVAYGLMRVTYTPMAKQAKQDLQNGYQLRQPLNEGINSISYMEYFQNLYCKYYKDLKVSYLPEYAKFIDWLKKLEGCRFLEELFVTGLMLYLSQFGEYKLDVFAKKFFRVAYSKRVSNKKAVRADSIPEFLREHKVLDHIAYGFTAEQVFESLDCFDLKVDEDGLNENTVKRHFVEETNKYFELGIRSAQYAERFADQLSQKIRKLGE